MSAKAFLPLRCNLKSARTTMTSELCGKVVSPTLRLLLLSLQSLLSVLARQRKLELALFFSFLVLSPLRSGLSLLFSAKSSLLFRCCSFKSAMGRCCWWWWWWWCRCCCCCWKSGFPPGMKLLMHKFVLACKNGVVSTHSYLSAKNFVSTITLDECLLPKHLLRLVISRKKCLINIVQEN